jgi:hypothetical protein
MNHTTAAILATLAFAAAVSQAQTTQQKQIPPELKRWLDMPDQTSTHAKNAPKRGIEDEDKDAWLDRLPESVQRGLGREPVHAKDAPKVVIEDEDKDAWLNRLPESVQRGLGREPVSRQIVPPAKYDRPYKGDLVFARLSTEADLSVICPKTAFRYKLACDFMSGKKADGTWERCQIFMVIDEVIVKAGFTPDAIYRHEQAHCNGWGTDHKGARLAP